MSPEDAQEFLRSQVYNIAGFMDYEVTIHSKEEFYHTLMCGLGSDRWQESGSEFVHLGHSGNGSEFAIWLRSNDDLRPVVFFGGEGGNGVLAVTAEKFVKALTYGPNAWEDHDEPSRLLLFDDHEEDEKEMLNKYRDAVSEIYSEIEPFETLTAGLDELNAEFAVFSETYNEYADPTHDDHVPEINHGDSNTAQSSVPEMNISEANLETSPPPKKKGFFARLFGKD